MFITYKITCNITGKYYIGSHKTDNINDGYMGSGKLIKQSIEKYGVENHTKEILGIFNSREESLNLEHGLIKQKKQEEKELCLNASFGGGSFDIINETMTFDRVYFGSLASHDYMRNVREANIKEYLKSPNKCVACGNVIPYDGRHNKFCSHSCAVTHSNKVRSGYKQKVVHCKYCGKSHVVPNSSKKQFCDNVCSSKYRYANGYISKKRELVLNDLPIIIKRHETESYRQIASDYGVSGNFIREAIRGKLTM